jgi:hypothetical protein
MTKPFSQKLQTLSSGNKPKTIKALVDTFEDQSFAVLFLFLMAIPALPLPTGGITHIFEIIVMMLSIELMLGRHVIWLPQKWLKLKLPDKFWTSTIPRLTKFVVKAESFSKPRLSRLTTSRFFGIFAGFIVFVFTLFAFLAPPFSGLDTLPALGVVIIALAMLLEDIFIGIAGLLVGFTGIALVITLGSVVFKLI